MKQRKDKTVKCAETALIVFTQTLSKDLDMYVRVDESCANEAPIISANGITTIPINLDEIERITFDFKTNKKIDLPMPMLTQILELKNHIKVVQNYNFENPIKVNSNKCNHCIYNNLCDKCKL